MHNTPELVWRYELKGYLTAKQDLTDSQAVSEASIIWSTLVASSAYVVGEGGLPLRLYCTVCHKVYGECRDNYSLRVPEMRVVYNRNQLANWAIGLHSLLGCYRLIQTRSFVDLGEPGSNRKTRRHLLAWLEHLKKSRI